MKLQDIVKSVLPVSKELKQAYLDKVKYLVDFYKPKIEEKTGIGLGPVDVREYVASSENFEPVSAIKNVFKKNMYSMFHQNDSILLPFGLKGNPYLLDNLKVLDQLVVHELSHQLWNQLVWKEIFNQKNNNRNKITGEPYRNKRQEKFFRIFSEGFATYCEQEFFADIYPEDYKIRKRRVPTKSPYYVGKKRVEQLVEKFGEDKLLEIPVKWHYLIAKHNKFDKIFFSLFA